METHAQIKSWYKEYLAVCQRYDFDSDALGQYVRDDFSLQGEQIGLDGFRRNLRNALKAWPDLEWHPVKTAIDMEQGPMICVWFDMYYNQRGERRHFQEVAFYKMKDGKMAEVEVMVSCLCELYGEHILIFDLQFWGGIPEGGQ